MVFLKFNKDTQMGGFSILGFQHSTNVSPSLLKYFLVLKKSSIISGRPLSMSAVRERGCPVRTFCGQGGGRGGSSSDCGLSRTFWIFFSKFMVSARTRGIEPVRTFCGEGGGV